MTHTSTQPILNSTHTSHVRSKLCFFFFSCPGHWWQVIVPKWEDWRRLRRILRVAVLLMILKKKKSPFHSVPLLHTLKFCKVYGNFQYYWQWNERYKHVFMKFFGCFCFFFIHFHLMGIIFSVSLLFLMLQGTKFHILLLCVVEMCLNAIILNYF